MAEPFTIYKLIVLYMAQHSREALTNSQISDFVLNRDYTAYGNRASEEAYCIQQFLL